MRLSWDELTMIDMMAMDLKPPPMTFLKGKAS